MTIDDDRGIVLSRGDTMNLTLLFSGIRIETGTYAVFAIKTSPTDAQGLIEKVMEVHHDCVTVRLTNGESETLEKGRYYWDVRIVPGAVIEDGRILDGAEVITPFPPARFKVVEAVADV